VPARTDPDKPAGAGALSHNKEGANHSPPIAEGDGFGALPKRAPVVLAVFAREQRLVPQPDRIRHRRPLSVGSRAAAKRIQEDKQARGLRRVYRVFGGDDMLLVLTLIEARLRHRFSRGPATRFLNEIQIPLKNQHQDNLTRTEKKKRIIELFTKVCPQLLKTTGHNI